MSEELALLALTAASVGVLHTALGPDHYLPFALMARAGRWPRRKTLGVTLACGLSHIFASVLLGAVGIALGATLARLEALESLRGRLAAWALIAFGIVYLVWGLRRAARHRPHTHSHLHADGTVHSHPHAHHGEHTHIHHEPGVARLTPWVLFLLVVFGPCEPLIPLLMVAAARGSVAGVALVAAAFAAATLATMLALVFAALSGLERLPLAGGERYTHALAGAAVVLCGAMIQALGL